MILNIERSMAPISVLASIDRSQARRASRTARLIARHSSA
jgi:hypothetical protein